MNIIITGSTGLVGSALIPSLLARGDEVTRLVRSQSQLAQADGTRAVLWNAESSANNFEQLEGHNAVVHLAGDPVAEGRWTDEKKRRIRDSRVTGTRVLVDSLAKLKSPPQTFVSASAIGFYGDRADEIVDETSQPGTGFLAETCQEWEAEALRYGELTGGRVVLLRIGIVLAKEGGALGKMLAPFKLGVGGTLGTGKQFMSWIAIDDLVRVIVFALESTELNGAVNAVAPNPVSNAEFTRTLGHVLNRPTLMSVPAFALRLMYGEMADAALLSGQRVLPSKLEASGFQFNFTHLEAALRHTLKAEQ